MKTKNILWCIWDLVKHIGLGLVCLAGLILACAFFLYIGSFIFGYDPKAAEFGIPAGIIIAILIAFDAG